MIVLIVLVAVTLLCRLAGVAGVAALDSWVASARWGLAAMLAFTGVAHFTRMREGMIRMLPPWVPWGAAVVAFTGVCELAGAIGILVPETRRLAGILLIVFFLAILPANIHAARAGIPVAGRPATPVVWRVPMQLGFILLAWWVTQP